jgi:DNA excision repair protein ERCC-4
VLIGADEPGTNIVLVMVASDRTALQLRQYLTTMEKTEPAFGPKAGRRMMETLFLSNWIHEKDGVRLSDPMSLPDMRAGDEVSKQGDMESKRAEERRLGASGKYYKRRRVRGGMAQQGMIRPMVDEA